MFDNTSGAFGVLAVTDRKGFYSFVQEGNWSGVVVPRKAGFKFDPEQREYENVIENMSNENYGAHRVNSIRSLDREKKVLKKKSVLKKRALK